MEEIDLVDYMINNGLALTRNEANRYIMGSAVYVNGERIVFFADRKMDLKVKPGDHVKVGHK